MENLLNLDQIGIFITNWYKIYFRKNSNMYDFTIKQIKEYEKKLLIKSKKLIFFLLILLKIIMGI